METNDPKFWEGVDPKWKFAAVDENGGVFLYEGRPNLGQHHWLHGSGVADTRHRPDWKETLVERPVTEDTSSIASIQKHLQRQIDDINTKLQTIIRIQGLYGSSDSRSVDTQVGQSINTQVEVQEFWERIEPQYTWLAMDENKEWHLHVYAPVCLKDKKIWKSSWRIRDVESNAIPNAYRNTPWYDSFIQRPF